MLEEILFFIEYIFLFSVFALAAIFYALVTKSKKKMDTYLVNELKFNTTKYEDLKNRILEIIKNEKDEKEESILRKETELHFKEIIDIYFDNGFFLKKRFVCEEINFQEENEKYKKELFLERFIKSAIYDLEEKIYKFEQNKISLEEFKQELNKFNREKEIIFKKYEEIKKGK